MFRDQNHTAVSLQAESMFVTEPVFCSRLKLCKSSFRLVEIVWNHMLFTCLPASLPVRAPRCCARKRGRASPLLSPPWRPFPPVRIWALVVGPAPHLSHQVCSFPTWLLLIRFLFKLFVISLIEILNIWVLYTFIWNKVLLSIEDIKFGGSSPVPDISFFLYRFPTFLALQKPTVFCWRWLIITWRIHCAGSSAFVGLFSNSNAKWVNFFRDNVLKPTQI